MDIDKLKADVAAATPGPWIASDDPEGNEQGKLSVHTDGGFFICLTDSCKAEWANARLIAQAPDLAAEVIRLTERLKMADKLSLAFCNLQERANGDYEDDNGERAYMVQHQEMLEASESLSAYREGKP